MVIAKKRLDLTLTDSNIVAFTAVSIFLPYVLTTLILISMSLYIIINKRTRKQIFVHSGSESFKLFFVYALAVAFMYRNWMGFAVGAAVILGLILGLFIRSVMNGELYERILTLICNMSLTSTGYAILEALINYIDDGRISKRISTVFFYPNYFGTVAATVIIISAYKILTSKENKIHYYIIAGLNMISLYLSMSIFACIEVFIGIMILLAVLHRHRLLMIWLLGAFIGAVLIFGLNIKLIPRISDMDVTLRLRQQIWEQAIISIKESPWLGHGFMSYGYLFGVVYHYRLVPHAHNIFIDMLLNFGIVGSILFSCYFVIYYYDLVKEWLHNKKNKSVVLILAVSAAAFVHGMTDITLLWVQTLPLFLIILSGFKVKTNA